MANVLGLMFQKFLQEGFDNALPGPHFSDFDMLLRGLRFVNQNESESKV